MHSPVSLSEHIRGLESVLQAFRSIEDRAASVGAELVSCYQRGGKVVVFGNGGSAAQADHFAAELIGRFRRTRKPLAALSLNSASSVLSCIGNDFGYEALFSRQVEALVKPEDVVFGLSTSGRSPNVLEGIEAASRIGATSVVVTGAEGLPAGIRVTHLLCVDSAVTAHIQEITLVLIHYWSEVLESMLLDG